MNGGFDLDAALARWRSRLRGPGIDGDAADELEDHLREEIAGLEAQGITAREALERALRRLGPVTALRAEFARAGSDDRSHPDGEPASSGAGGAGAAGVRGGHFHGGGRPPFAGSGRRLREIGDDLRSTVRRLARRPGLTLLAVVMLAAGIGATTALYSVVEAVLLAPLPFPEPDRLFLLDEAPATASPRLESPESALDWAPRLPSFSGLSLFHPFGGDANLSGDGGEPARIRVSEVSPGFFDLLGLPPGPGRGFAAGESRPGRNRVVVVSRELWRTRYGADPGVVGRTLELDGHPYTIVGVAPAGPKVPGPADAWVPLAFEGPWRIRGARFFQVLGRVEAGVDLAAARQDVAGFNEWLRREFAGTSYAERSVGLVRLRDRLVGGVRMPLWILIGAVGLALAATIANLANLLLARARSRRRDLAVRAALGSSRGRLIRQSLLESSSLAVLGGLLGLGLARAGLAVFVSRAGGTFPRIDAVGLDGRVLAFALTLTVLTGLAVGILPTLGVARDDIVASLSGGVRQGRARSRGRDALVVVQVALALVLVIGSGLLVRSYLAVLSVDPGFDVDGVMTFAITLPDTGYPDADSRTAFYRRLRERLAGLPDIVSVASSNYLPLADDTAVGLFLRPAGRPEAEPVPATYVVSGGAFFRTLGSRVVRGRGFDESDDAGATPVIALNRAAARELGLGDDAVGRRVTIVGQEEPRAVVAVVSSSVHFGVESEADPQVYVPHAQSPWDQRYFLLRTTSDPGGLAASVRAIVGELDSDLPVYDVATMEERLSADRARRRATTGLLVSFALVALLLSAMGLHGAASNWVVRRTREIGIRLAVGASPARIRRQVVRAALRLAVTGLALGLTVGLAAVRLLESLLFGVEPLDPPTLAVALLALATITVAAVAHPAHRAATLDPVEALGTG